MEITLNIQQKELLMDILVETLQKGSLSNSVEAIINQILNKLDQE